MLSSYQLGFSETLMRVSDFLQTQLRHRLGCVFDLAVGACIALHLSHCLTGVGGVIKLNSCDEGGDAAACLYLGISFAEFRGSIVLGTVLHSLILAGIPRLSKESLCFSHFGILFS